MIKLPPSLLTLSSNPSATVELGQRQRADLIMSRIHHKVKNSTTGADASGKY